MDSSSELNLQVLIRTTYKQQKHFRKQLKYVYKGVNINFITTPSPWNITNCKICPTPERILVNKALKFNAAVLLLSNKLQLKLCVVVYTL